MGSEPYSICSAHQTPDPSCGLCNQQPLDLDALLAIDAKRTPGEWHDLQHLRSMFAKASSAPRDYRQEEQDARNFDAIVSAVNALCPLVERCRRAERSDAFHTEACDAHLNVIDQLEGRIAELTRQRDELAAMLTSAIDLNYEHGSCHTMAVESRRLLGSVKGGADGA